MLSKSLLAIILTVTLAGCSPSVESNTPEVSSDASQLSPFDSLVYALPEDTDLTVLQKGEIDGAPNSYLLLIGSPNKIERLVLIAFPAVESNLP